VAPVRPVAPPATYNMADVWEMAADAVPTREALVVGDRRCTYAQLEERANRLAHALRARGVVPGDHVAVYLENCPEYLEVMLAAFKLRAVPVNVNHRYVAGELAHLLADSGSVAVVTQPSLAARVASVGGELAGLEGLGAAGGGAAGGGAAGGGAAGGGAAGAGALPALRFALVTGDGSGRYEDALAAASPARPEVPGRGNDDHYVIYTGGTTGMPKGVVWRHEDAFFACIGGGDPMRLLGPVSSPAELPARMNDTPLCYLPLAPMMHAAAQWTSLSRLFAGDKVVLMAGALDPAAVWRTVAAEGVNLLTVVGDAVARPLLDEWDRAGPFGVPSLYSVSNGGAPMSPATRARLFATLPNVIVTDGFGSSEAGTQGASRVAAADGAAAGEGGAVVRFDSPAKPTLVLDLEGNEVEPGSGEVGMVLAGGHLPLGYHNDPKRTARAFVERDGQRWLVTGDMATVAADGSIELRGRGSQVINSGGEKVFPEEVESALKGHADVYDCLVVGVPDDRWGSAVCAVVQPVAGATPTLDALVAHCRGLLAGYKAPKRLVLVDHVERSPSGKADYRWAATVAAASADAQVTP
jgi:acyl-CoA synthetase (AMP-forming)/AMP-acid ligase II